jgi:hypothetical protein
VECCAGDLPVPLHVFLSSGCLPRGSLWCLSRVSVVWNAHNPQPVHSSAAEACPCEGPVLRIVDDPRGAKRMRFEEDQGLIELPVVDSLAPVLTNRPSHLLRQAARTDPHFDLFRDIEQSFQSSEFRLGHCLWNFKQPVDLRSRRCCRLCRSDRLSCASSGMTDVADLMQFDRPLIRRNPPSLLLKCWGIFS